MNQFKKKASFSGNFNFFVNKYGWVLLEIKSDESDGKSMLDFANPYMQAQTHAVPIFTGKFQD